MSEVFHRPPSDDELSDSLKERLSNAFKDTNPKDAVGVRKACMSVMPRGVMYEAALGMLEGARKYARHNYRAVGVRSSVYYDAVMRHLDAFWEGEDIDPDSGLPHIVKAICTLVVLRDAQMNGLCVDDRPPRLPEGWLQELNRLAADIIDRYPEAKEPYTEVGMRKQDDGSSDKTPESILREMSGPSRKPGKG